MKVTTRLFGEIEIADEKIITFTKGLVGFPEMKKFTLIYDEEKADKGGIMWMQSMDEPQFAMPVINPNYVKEDYNPTVNDEMIAGLGDITEENLCVFVTITVPKDIEQMTVNLKGPIMINTDTLAADQIVVEDDFPVRFPVYEILKAKKEKAGE